MLRSTALLLLALSCSAPAVARPLVELTVIDRESRQPLPRAFHRGQHWIAGEPGHRYSVQLTNNSAQRVLVVLSVDGINAVTGEVADPSQGGYVLAPWQSTQVAGWRKSYQDVAQFVFSGIADSYAARTGRPDHVGVIGIAVFEQARAQRRAHVDASGPGRASPPVASRPAAEARQNQAAEAKSRSRVAEDSSMQTIGTGHGAREWSPVGSTSFARASHVPAQVTQLRYDAHATLVARGILPGHPHHDGPQAFPGAFVADPPRY